MDMRIDNISNTRTRDVDSTRPHGTGSIHMLVDTY